MALSFHNRPSLVAYVTCGDPNLATTRDIALAAIEAGADVLELGVPFSDPVADGPVHSTCQRTSLASRNNAATGVELAKEIRQRSEAGLIIFTYLNPIVRMGMASLASGGGRGC